MVIFDDDYNLKSAMVILRELGLSERIYICKNSWQNKERLPRENPKSFILFGNCSDFLNENIAAPCILIMPPPHFTKDTKKSQKSICRSGITDTINYGSTSRGGKYQISRLTFFSLLYFAAYTTKFNPTNIIKEWNLTK